MVGFQNQTKRAYARIRTYITTCYTVQQATMLPATVTQGQLFQKL